MRTIKIAGGEYECGGTLIHPANEIMTNLVNDLGLKKREAGPDQRFSLITADGVIFKQWTYLSSLQMVLRYGLVALIKLYYYIQNMLVNFGQIYPKLNEGNYVETVADLLRAMAPTSRKGDAFSEKDSMLDLTDLSLEEELLKQGLPKQLSDELVMAAARVNYGQTTRNLHAFVGSVALAGAQGGLWSIHGGNHVLAEKLLASSKAELVQAKVDTVELLQDGKFRLYFDSNNTELFDQIILAIPFSEETTTEIQFKGFPEQFVFTGRYHRTVASMVHGEVDPGYIGLSGQDEMTEENFIVDPNRKVNSFAKQIPVNYESSMAPSLPNVWKVFSQEPLTDQELDQIFLSRTETVICDWLAYPHYVPKQRSTLSKFLLHDNLYAINAIEWAASAMEMSVLGAKNVANMAVSKWTEGSNGNTLRQPSLKKAKIEL